MSCHMEVFLGMQAHPESLTPEIIEHEVQKNPSPNMECVQYLLKQYRLTLPKINDLHVVKDPPDVFMCADMFLYYRNEEIHSK